MTVIERVEITDGQVPIGMVGARMDGASGTDGMVGAPTTGVGQATGVRGRIRSVWTRMIRVLGEPPKRRARLAKMVRQRNWKIAVKQRSWKMADEVVVKAAERVKKTEKKKRCQV